MSMRPLEGDDPDYRLSLANERTFLAWIRTSLGLLAGGVAVVAVLPSVDHPLLRDAVGLVLLALAVALPPLAYRRWSATEVALLVLAAVSIVTSNKTKADVPVLGAAP